jgi:hypothetical protein
MVVGVLMFSLVLAGPAFAQNGAGEPLGLPQDWSFRHLIYSNPETAEEAASRGMLGAWNRKANDPRFLLQLEKKRETAKASANEGTVGDDGAAVGESGVGVWARAGKSKPSKPKGKPSPSPSGPEIPRDWSNVMGGASGAGAPRLYPAKFSFSISSKSCSADFVVFTTSSAGATSTGSFYQATGTFTGLPVAGQTVTITNLLYAPDQVLTLTADASVNTGLKFAVGANLQDAATNLADAIERNGGTVGMTATATGAAVVLNSITANVKKADITPAETLSNFSWVEENDGSATAGQPTVFALNQLYADTVANGGCQTPTQQVPAVYWSYNTGMGAIADLSPVLSFYDNGHQVAFVQRSGTVASLVLLKWSSTVSVGTLGEPTAPTSVTPANYRSCTAPCMTVMTFTGSPNDTNSAPFVDYLGDILYVGDDTGNVHKFTGVFQGTPAEAGSPWPVSVGTTSILSSPVFDPTSGLIFVGSNGPGGGSLSGNRLHSINASTGAVISSGAIGSDSSGANANGVRDAPIVDSTGHRVYAFMGAANPAADSLDNSCLGGHPWCAAVYQFVTTSSLATQDAGLGAGLGAKVIVGASDHQGDLNRTINSGAFDDAYYSTGSGSLYVCGSLPDAQRRFTLWKITVAGNSFSARTQGPQINNANGTDVCSPVTVFKNGSSEFLYASVANAGSAAGGGGCTDPGHGCVYEYNLAPSYGTVFDTTSTSSTATGANRFISVSTSTGLNGNEGAVDTLLTAGTAGTYAGMTITQSVASPAGTTYTYTLRNNTTSQAITCQITEGNTTCSDTTHRAGFSTGDLIDVLVVRTTGSTDLTATFRVQLTADVTWNDATSASAAIHAQGGTGGIIVDNTLTGGGSQVYYSTRTSPGIAVQASQAGLQ